MAKKNSEQRSLGRYYRRKDAFAYPRSRDFRSRVTGHVEERDIVQTTENQYRKLDDLEGNNITSWYLNRQDRAESGE